MGPDENAILQRMINRVVLFAAAFFAATAAPAAGPARADVPQPSSTVPFSSGPLARTPAGGAPLKTRLVLPTTEFAPGKSYPVLLEVAIQPEYHINSDKPLDKALFATSVKFTSSNPALTFGRVAYPPAKMRGFKFTDVKLSVYDGTIYISTSVSLAEDAKGPADIRAHLDYQACTESTCLMPNAADAESPLGVGTNGRPLEEALFAQNAPRDEGDVFHKLRGGVGLAGLLLVFAGGLALNLTPCVYPMIPVTVGYFSAVAKARTRRKRTEHALVYLMGMSLMYSSLGVVAALTGSLFGGLMQNTFVVLVMVALMLALSASMFGAFEIIVPAPLMEFGVKTHAGFLGSFFMGLTVGILAAPCVGPFVIGLLTFVGERQDPTLGFLLFFTLSLGLGLPLTVLAVFSGAVSSLPRSGVWMVWVRKVFGVVMLGMAAYFARPLLGGEAALMKALFAIAVAGGAYLFYAGRGIGGKIFQLFRCLIALAFLAVGTWLVMPATASKRELPFTEYSREALATSLKTRRFAIIDFTADWCVPCRELKAFTFSDPRVLKMKDEFAAFSVDLTKVDDKKLGYKKEYGVLGVPTVIIVKPDGREADRFTGFVTADDFLKKVDALK
jgi:thiol:disulfide interchange protein DsbD